MENTINGVTSMVLNLNFNLTELPKCPTCADSRLIPFPDETYKGTSVIVKAWVCPKCGSGIQMKSGELFRFNINPLPKLRTDL